MEFRPQKMLIVSDVKIRQVREAIENWVSGVLVLRGPSGSGKTTALMHACDHGSVVEAGDREVVQLALRLEHIATTMRSGRKIIVTRDNWQLEKISRNCHLFPHVLVVVILGESDLSFRRIDNVFVIAFTGFSDTAIRKLVTAYTAEDVEAVVMVSGGDARQALVELELRGISTDTVRECIERAKRKRNVDNKDPSSVGRDNAFSLFHTLGKVLYNKHKENCGLLANQPVVADSGDVVLLTLHENFPDFVGDVSTLERLMRIFIDADCWLRTSPDRNWFVFESVMAINQTSPDERSVRGFAAFRRPAIRDHTVKLKTRMSGVHFVRSIVGRWIDYKSVGILDSLMQATRGQCPQELSFPIKRAIYNIMHGNAETQVGEGELISPQQLEDDPVEDC